MKNIKRITFVCHGNICRSPMAEFTFKNMLLEQGLLDEFEVNSCATSSEEIWNGIGNPVYPPAKRELSKHGISCEGKRAVKLLSTDYDKSDLFICMDSYNVKNTLRIFGADKQNKVCKLLDFCGGGDVADPWYTDRFDITYNDILRGLKALLEDLMGNE